MAHLPYLQYLPKNSDLCIQAGSLYTGHCNRKLISALKASLICLTACMINPANYKQPIEDCYEYYFSTYSVNKPNVDCTITMCLSI